MKRMLALLLALVMVVGLVACGSSSPAESDSTPPATTEATEATETTETTEAVEEAVTVVTEAPAEETFTVTCQDLTMTVTAARLEDKTEEWANGATGCYVINNDFAIMAIREDKSTVGGDPDLESYAASLIMVNDFDCEVVYHEDIPYFTYTAEGEEEEFTHIVSVYRGTDSYWFLQTYAATEQFSALEAQIWDVLTTVSIA